MQRNYSRFAKMLATNYCIRACLIASGKFIGQCEREMARTVEDVLSRRIRALPLDAKAAKKGAAIARIMAANWVAMKRGRNSRCHIFRNWQNNICYCSGGL